MGLVAGSGPRHPGTTSNLTGSQVPGKLGSTRGVAPLAERAPDVSLDRSLRSTGLVPPPAPDSAYRLIDPSAVTPRAVEWAWRHRIATGTLTIVAGPGGVGKGALSVELTARLTHGQLDGDLRGVPQRVLVLTAEENVADVVAPRLHAAGADLQRVRVLTMQDGEYDRDVTLPDDLGHVREAVETSSPPWSSLTH